MSFVEQAFSFDCAGEALLGIIAMPENALKTGVLIIVGGPQYRAGSHRQFLLLSRHLAEAGYPAMRFDSRGMGDSSGELCDFESIANDVASAIDVFFAKCPELERIVLWGLCDAASASLLYWDKTKDIRVTGMVLLNPWVRSEASLAKTQIKHYYGQRLFQADFWRKFFTGNLGVGRALCGLLGSVKNAHRLNNGFGQNAILPFHKKMARGLESFSGTVLFLLSGNDYTAKEFLESVKADPVWERSLNRVNVSQKEIPEADHTFSSIKWRGQVENMTRQWLDKRAG